MQRQSPASPLTEAEFLRRLLLAALLAAGLAALYLLSDLVLLVFAAVLVAIALRAIGDPISSLLGIGPRWSLALAIVIVLGVLTATVFLFGYQIAAQAQGLVERLPQAAGRLREIFQLDVLGQLFSGNGSASTVTSMVSRALSWSFSLAGAIASLAIVVFGGIYIAIDPQLYRDGLLKLIPPARQPLAETTLDDCAVALRRWLGAQLAAMAAVGVLVAVGLTLAGVPSAIALGFIAGIAEFVPYIGPIAAAIPGLILAGSQGWQMLLAAALVYVIVQQAENNLIVPLLASRSVAIPPALAAFAIVAMGILFGPLGLLLGFPLSVVLDVAVRRLYVREALGEEVEIAGEPAEAVASEGLTPPASSGSAAAPSGSAGTRPRQ